MIVQSLVIGELGAANALLGKYSCGQGGDLDPGRDVAGVEFCSASKLKVYLLIAAFLRGSQCHLRFLRIRTSRGIATCWERPMAKAAAVPAAAV